MTPVVAFDSETFWDSKAGYTLKKMPAHEYVRDPRFEIIGVCVKVGDTPRQCFSGTMRETKEWLDQFELHKCAVVSHHMSFDASVLAAIDLWPKYYVCTESMVRPFLKPILRSLSLGSVSEHLSSIGVKGLHPKGDDVQRADGLRRLDFTAQHLRQYVWNYCGNDTDDAYAIYKWARPMLSPVEMRIIDMTIRMYVQPMFELSATAYQQILKEIVERKAKILAEMEVQGVTAEMLRSNLQFAGELRKRGIEPPMKVSLASLKRGDNPPKMTFAFSKADPEFIALREEYADDMGVSLLLGARLSEKSTIEERRAEALLDMAKKHGRFHVYLNSYGAHTGRYTGTGKENPLNLPKPVRFELGADGRLKKVFSKMRNGIRAPKGYVIQCADKAQIECRIVNTLAGQEDVVAGFRTGACVYSACASGLFNTPVSREAAAKDSAIKKLRDVGKAIILGSGFGMGWEKFMRSVRKDGLVIGPGEAASYIDYYRERYDRVPLLWSAYENALRNLIVRREPTTIGPVTFEWLDEKKRLAGIRLPNGLHLMYPRLRMVKDSDGRWVIACNQARDKNPRKLWGGIVTENIVQALAGILIREDMVNLWKTEQWRTGLQVYDEVVGLTPLSQLDRITAAMFREMTRSPVWLPNLPVAIDVSYGPSYGEQEEVTQQKSLALPAGEGPGEGHAVAV